MSWFADTASWALILGVLTPLLTSVVQQPQWSDRTRAVVGAAVSILVGIITVIVNGGFDGNVDASRVVGLIALVLVASQAAYRNLWKPAGISPAIENATSPGSNNRYVGEHERGEVDVTKVIIIAVVIAVVVLLLSAFLPGQ